MIIPSLELLYNTNVKLSAWVSTSDLLNKKGSGFGEFIFKKFIKQSIFADDDPEEVLLALKKNGVNGIEFLASSNIKEKDIENIKNMLKKLDLKAFSIHQSVSTLFDMKIAEVKSLFEIAKRLGSEVVVLHISSIGSKIFDKKYTGKLKEMEKRYGIKIGIENMPINLLWFYKTYTWREDDFCSAVYEAGLDITFDVTHLAQTGKDVVKFYKNNKDRIINIHLSDYKKHFLNNPLMLTKDTHLPLADGTLPINQFLKTLNESKYNGIVTMEINGKLSEILKSIRIIKSIL